MAVKEKDYSENVALLESVMEHSGTSEDNIATYNIKQSDFMTFMKNQGITEDTIRQVAEAEIDYLNSSLIAAKNKLVGDKDVSRVVIKTRTPMGPREFRYTRRVDTRVVKTNEKSEKWGVVSVNYKVRTRVDKELLAQCAQEVKDAQ